MRLYYLFYILAILVKTVPTYGQVVNSNYRLLVTIEEPNKKIEEKLEVSELTAYREEIEKYNVFLKTCIEKYWKIDVKVDFINKSKAEQIIKDKTLNTLIINNTKYSFNYADFSSYKLSKKLFQNKEVLVENYNKKHLPYRASLIEIRKADSPANSAPIATVSMPSIIQDEAELTYAIKSLALQIDYKNKGTTEVQLMKMYIKNAPHLKELTLLINHSDLDESLKSETGSHYKLPYQLVNKEDIDKAILNADKTKAVTLMIPNSDGSFSFKVFDASSMEMLGYSSTIPPSEYYPELNNKIKANNLEEFTHYSE